MLPEISESFVLPEPREMWQERVRRIKAYNRIEDVISQMTGAVFKKTGSSLMCRCMFPDHEDSTPSFAVNVAKQYFKCFGCGRQGDHIQFVRLWRNCSFAEAVNILDPNGSSTQPLLSQMKTNGKKSELIKRLRDFFHERLLESQAGQDYLEKRGLKDGHLIKYFHLGFDDGRINAALSSDVISPLSEMGYLNDKKHSRFYQCITVGLEDAEGNIVGLYGRRINTNKGSKHQFAKGKVSGILHSKVFKACKEIIFTEGPIDMLSVFVMEYMNVSCIFSASSIPELLIAMIRQYNTKRILMALDNDKAGEAACRRFAQALSGLDIELRRLEFPPGIKDANELLVKYGRDKARETFTQMLATAKPFGTNGQDGNKTKSHKQAVQTSQETPAKDNTPYTEKPGMAESSAIAPTPCTSPTPTSAPAVSPVSVSTPVLPIAVVKHGEALDIQIGERSYRVHGVEKNTSYDIMKIKLRVAQGDKLHMDIFDLYQAKQRVAFIHQASQELGISPDVIKDDMGKILLALEQYQDKQIQRTLKPEKPQVVMSEREEQEALALLKDPHLVTRIVEDFRTCGLVGEETNSLVGYLCTLSRKLDDPLALIIQALSAAGKTMLIESILRFVPPEDVIRYSAITGQSLYYMGEKELAHKILVISEQEGAEKATYAIKIMLSEKSLRIASTGKDPKTGKMITHEYYTEGPMQHLISTTKEEIDEELLNRCLLLTSNCTREQTQAIHQMQREKETLAGMLRIKERERIARLHQNAQRLLRPLTVVNPFADKLTFLDTKLRTRRDHAKYLTLIRTIALLHQYQREVKKKMHNGEMIAYIEVTVEDIALANRLVNEVMGISLDELAPQTRKLLGLIHTMVKQACEKQKIEQSAYEFTQREVRDCTGWGHTQTKIHLQRLVEMEYVLAQRQGQRYVYRLMYKGEGEDGSKFMPGLINVEELKKKC
jgi:DNA primase catalytic core